VSYKCSIGISKADASNLLFGVRRPIKRLLYHIKNSDR